MACNKIAGYHYLYYAQYGIASDALTSGDHYLGVTGPEGIRLNRETQIEEITSDELGPNAIIDGVYQGDNITLEFVIQDVNKEIVQALMHPFQTEGESVGALDVTPELVGIPGKFVCGVIGTLVALPLTGTPAADFTGVANADGTPGRRFKGINIGPVLETLDTTPRFVPIRFQAYPYQTTADVSAGTLRYWEWVSGL